MRILGVGVDIVNNKRVKMLSKNKKFIERTFGKNELRLSKNILNKNNYFSKRFAAKESFSKAIGTGFRNSLNLKDVEVLNNKIGKPYFLKTKKINKIVLKLFKVQKYDLFLSISDEKDYSIAFTILQKK